MNHLQQFIETALPKLHHIYPSFPREYYQFHENLHIMDGVVFYKDSKNSWSPQFCPSWSYNHDLKSRYLNLLVRFNTSYKGNASPVIQEYIFKSRSPIDSYITRIPIPVYLRRFLLPQGHNYLVIVDRL